MSRPPNPPSLARHQAERLTEAAAAGMIKQEALASFLVRQGYPCDQSTISRWCRAETTAPFWLDEVILFFVDDPAAYLSITARKRGLRVVPDVQAASAQSVESAIGDVVLQAGRAFGVIREITADGVITHDEAIAGLAALDVLAQEVAEARAALDAHVWRAGPRVVS